MTGFLRLPDGHTIIPTSEIADVTNYAEPEVPSILMRNGDVYRLDGNNAATMDQVWSALTFVARSWTIGQEDG
jgi:hypothetical protein